MKIQELSIIFVIIIIPISIVLSTYTQMQIQTLNVQAIYDTKLTTATFDAIKAFQLNTANSTLAELSNSKLRDIEASVTTFKNSMMSTFKLNGYTEKDMNNYIPALVYTMYNGFYLYSPYDNYNNLYEYDYDVNIINGKENYTLKTDASGNPLYKYDAEGNKVPLNDNGETLYGLKPYITYSCRYTKGNIDVVITYSLDNYITVQGKIGTDYVNKEGYLIDGITYSGDADNPTSVSYNGVAIESETLYEYVEDDLFPYVKINGTKYYYDAGYPNSDGSNGIIFYMANGKRTRQGNAVRGKTIGQVANEYYQSKILNNKSAMKYYAEAAEFTEWVRNELSSLTYADASEVINVKNGDVWVQQNTQLFPDGTNKYIFDASMNIENDMSNFNRHRIDVIKHKIESNLAVAISNYNHYSLAQGIEFQLPKLTDEEWDLAINNICLISFVQGLDIGGKIYNGYTVVNNTETKEVVQEENIFILGKDNYYHRIGDMYLSDDPNNVGGFYDTAKTKVIPIKSAGRVNLDFERQKKILQDSITHYYYPLSNFYGSYNSIITQNNVTTYEDIYEYIQEQKDAGNVNLAQAFYTALGRERMGLYKALRTDLLY